MLKHSLVLIFSFRLPLAGPHHLTLGCRWQPCRTELLKQAVVRNTFLNLNSLFLDQFPCTLEMSSWRTGSSVWATLRVCSRVLSLCPSSHTIVDTLLKYCFLKWDAYASFQGSRLCSGQQYCTHCRFPWDVPPSGGHFLSTQPGGTFVHCTGQHRCPDMLNHIPNHKPCSLIALFFNGLF